MKSELSIGVDLGGTKIEVLVAQTINKGELRILARERVATERERGYDTVLNTCAELVGKAARKAGIDATKIPIGIGMPGAISRQDGLIKNSNTTCLNGRPFRQDLQKLIGRSIVFENDANCFALAEAHLGAGRKHIDGLVFGVILGTGVGGGFVWGGNVWHGPQGLGGEWGHHVIYHLPPENSTGADSIRKCYCGQSGCVETYVSGPAAENDYFNRSGQRLRLSEIVKMRETDSNAKRVVELLLDSFARGIANVINIIDPSAIVLGGGVSNLDCLYTEGIEKIRALVFNDELSTPILKNELGDSAGVFGAAILALGSNR